jgi:hypothetical protein
MLFYVWLGMLGQPDIAGPRYPALGVTWRTTSIAF